MNVANGSQKQIVPFVRVTPTNKTPDFHRGSAFLCESILSAAVAGLGVDMVVSSRVAVLTDYNRFHLHY